MLDQRGSEAEAGEHCRAIGGELPLFKSMREQKSALNQINAGNTGFWAGFYARVRYDFRLRRFVDKATREPVGFVNWGRYSFDGLREGGECLYVDNYGIWMAAQCGDRLPVVCQITVRR